MHLQADGWEAAARRARPPPTAAVGEVGLDRFRLDAPFESQVGAFTAQLALAAELRRPLIVHCVRADGVLLDTLRAAAAAASPGGGLPPILVMHAFGGSPETARALLQLAAREGVAAYFGFSPRAAKLRAAAVMAAVPGEYTHRVG